MEKKQRLDVQTMALRAGKEFKDGDVINLGLGVPTLASNFVPLGREVLFHTENGALGFGPICNEGEGDMDIINASGQPVELLKGACFFDHSDSFAMIRGGYIDLSILGGLQVSEKGDLANWMVPENKVGSIGGAMDLAFRAKRVIIIMSHVTKENRYKILKRCSYPLTAPRCVDLIITDIAVIEVTDKGLVLKETAPGWTTDEIQRLTEPILIIDPDCQDIELI